MTSLLYDNRRLLALAVALILVAGLSAFATLPRLEDPVLTKRVAIINTLYAGAKAGRVEALVTEPIEEELEEITEIKELRSTSRAGISTVTVELRDDVYESEEVWSRVRDKLDDAQPLLPEGASEPDFEDLEVTAYAAVVALTWELPGEPGYAILLRKAEELEQLLRDTPGTREVDTFGDPAEEITVEVRQAELAALGLSVDRVARQLAASDAKVAAGQLRAPDGNLLLEVDTELDSLERVAETPIQYGADGRFVMLGDIAIVTKGVTEPPTRLAIVDGRPAVALGVYVRGDYRIDHWAAASQEVLDEYRATLPPGIRLVTVFEQSPYVEHRLETLLGNLAMGAAAVMLVIWVMMGWRSALVVGAALPLASLMVLAGMALLGVPIHQMSVTGLIIALGLLIDNAIVVTDEVRGKLRAGRAPRDAVSSSVRHLALPLLGSTLTTALSFAPIALMPGPAGEFVGSIAISVVLAVVSSLLLALTVTPALAAIVARIDAAGGRSHWWSDGFSSARLTAVYRRVLSALFRRPAWGVGVAVVLPIAGFFAATTLTEQFFPPADRDQFQVQLELPAHAPMGATAEMAAALRERMLEHPRVERVDWFLGESAPSFYYNLVMNRHGVPQYAQAIVHVDRDEGVREVIRELQRDLDRAFPTARTLVRQLEQGPPFDAPIEVRLFGPDLEVLHKLGQHARRVLAETPNVLHTSSDLAEALPKLALTVDEAEARLAGLDHRAIAEQLDATLEGAVGGSILEETEDLPVRVRVADDRRSQLDEVTSLDLVAGSAGRPNLPLSALAKVSLTPEIAAIPHFDSQRMNEVKAYLTAGVLPAEALAAFQERLAASGFELPPGYRLEYGGEADKRDQAVGNLMSSVGVLMVLMVATLVLSFNSFRMAAIVGSVGALSIGLGLGSLALFGFPFGFMAIVGTMGLAGVAINDTIVVLAALREDPAARTGDPDAVRDVVVRATRHVLSTTLTTIAGFLPLLLGGGGFWPPLATAIAGGVGGATLLALSFAPASYILLMCPKCSRARQEQPADLTVSRPISVSHHAPAPVPAGAAAAYAN